MAKQHARYYDIKVCYWMDLRRQKITNLDMDTKYRMGVYGKPPRLGRYAQGVPIAPGAVPGAVPAPPINLPAAARS
jgi:hypothetical protein